jgi:hypothetical protein
MSGSSFRMFGTVSGEEVSGFIGHSGLEVGKGKCCRLLVIGFFQKFWELIIYRIPTLVDNPRWNERP